VWHKLYTEFIYLSNKPLQHTMNKCDHLHLDICISTISNDFVVISNESIILFTFKELCSLILDYNHIVASRPNKQLYNSLAR
jgi:hypothetical protein